MNTAMRLLFVVVALTGWNSAIATEYSFSRVYTGPANPGVAINDNGLVAIACGVYQPNGYTLITTDGDTSTVIASGTDIVPQVLSLNNDGFVAFGRGQGSRQSVFASNGVTSRQIAIRGSSPGSAVFYNISPEAMSINDSGMVAFVARQTSTSGYYIYLGDGTGAPVQLNTRDGYYPAMNNAETVAYGLYNSGKDSCIEIQRGNDTLSLPGSPVRSMPDINSVGTVAFAANVDDIQKIVIGDGISSPTYIDGIAYKGGLTSGYAFDGGISDCAINDQGLVAFGAYRDVQAVGYGIFVGPDPATDKVIMQGDLLDGATLTSLMVSRNGLNNLGQIAFSGRLSDGTVGVWVATPLPEPSALVLLAIGAVSVLAYVRRQRTRGQASSQI
jgi:hypothetical protein